MQRTAHSIIHLNIMEGAIGNSIPLLVLVDGTISALAMMWARELMLQQHVSPVGLFLKISGLGRFYDYFVIAKSGTSIPPGALLVVLEQFEEARRFGSSVMAWPAVTPDTAAADVDAVLEFSDWCAKNFGTASINPAELKLVSDLTVGQQHDLREWRRHRHKGDLLAHLEPTTAHGQGLEEVREYKAERQKKGSGTCPKKYFPPTHVREFIKHLSLRDALYFLLLFFGGLRASEPLHIFVGDVSIMKDGQVRVVLNHPEYGSYSWVNSAGRVQRGKRINFLRERYQLGPRNRLGPKHPLHAGWKGVSFEDDKFDAHVHWLRPDAARLFAQLHVAYMRNIRSRVPDNHPYYLVNTRLDSDFGNPVTLSNMNKAFERGARRVGLSTTEPGVNPHGGRHYYGYFHANVYKTRLEMLQMFMHHASPESTRVYYNLTEKTANEELKKAYEKLAADFPDFLRLDALSHREVV